MTLRRLWQERTRLAARGRKSNCIAGGLQACFSEPKVNVIESDEGFSVEVLGRTGLLYVEGERSARLDSEILIGEPAMVVYINRLKSWNVPYEKDAMDKEVRDRIAESIRRALQFKGHEVEFVT